MIGLCITICTYFLIFSFWSDLVLKFKISNLVGLSLVNATIYFALLLWCIIAIKRKKFLVWNEIYKYLLIMFFIAIVSIFVKILNPEVRGVKIIHEIFYLKNWSEGFIIFVVFYNILDGKKYCLRSLSGLIVFFMFCNSIMLIDWFDFVDIPGIHKRNYGESSGFGNPNDYAAYMLLFLFTFFSSFIISKNKMHKYSSLVCLIISLMAFLMTGSRGGFISLLIASLFYFILIKNSLKSKKRLKYIILFCSLLLVPILMLPETFIEDYKDKIIPESSADINKYSHGRSTIWTEGLNIFAESPIFGSGFNSFSILLEKRKGITAVAHNRYLQYLVDFGLIGIFSYLLIQISLFKQTYKVFNNTFKRSEKIILVNYLSGLIGYSISLIFVNGEGSSVLFWFYSAVILRFSQFLKENKV
ncbi:O-antigen ligase family protein [uncultured Desulfosarcina sp.]|uniref:O-antigen ligase family protein n=1 Tax=uncultured Desulfosarcina sp. TaxID=218289 RepID=UPI0037484ECA